MKNTLPFIFVFLILLVLPLVSSAPPTQTNVNINVGYDVELVTPESFQTNQSYSFHAHVWNRSSGLPILNTAGVGCVLHVYNSETGSHLIEGAMTADPDNIYDWNYSMGQAVLRTTGEGAAMAFCNNSAYGGFTKVEFEVTPTGDESAFGLQIFLFIFLFGLVILGFFIKNEWIVILSGMGLIALGIFSLTQGISSFRNDLTQMVSLVTIGIGAIVSIVTALQVIYDEL